jgi:hypothetical protein
MFGGSPIMSSAPAFLTQVPVQGYAVPSPVNQPLPRSAPAPAWRERAPVQPDLASRPLPQGPVFRGQSAEESEPAPRQRILPPAPVALVLPPPDKLGVTAAAPCGADWADVHRRLEQLGALSFHQEKLTAGGCRIIVVMPTDRRDRAHQVEADAPTEAEAVGLALQRAEKWASLK